MSWKVVSGMVFAFVLLTLVNGWVEGTYFPETDTATLNELVNFNITQYNNPITGIIGIGEYVWDWVRFFFKAVSFDYAFLEGNMIIFRFLFWCLPAGIIYGIIKMVRGTS